MPRRLQALVVASALVAAPALVLRALCAGRSCARPARAAADVPFCSLPEELRALISAGFRERRSPEILAVTGERGVFGGDAFGGRIRPGWPSAAATRAHEVPVAFAGDGIRAGPLPPSFSLDDVAPTLADILGLRRPHPEVRSGRPVAGLWTGDPPRLAIEVVLKGVGTPQVTARPDAWPYLHELLRTGAATPAAEAGSVPLDPAATLTTIGTGGLPRQHGITGTLVRNDAGRLARAWGPGAPPSVIATLADDLDERTRQRARVGLVATSAADRGVIGKRWYLDVDRDAVVYSRRDPVERAERLLNRGYGTDAVADLLAVVASGAPARLDHMLRRITAAARRAAGSSFVLVVTATGSATAPPHGVPAAEAVSELERAIEGPPGVVEAAAPGGLFIDEQAVVSRKLSEDEVLRALDSVRSDGRRVFADRFGAIAVSFGRYC